MIVNSQVTRINHRSHRRWSLWSGRLVQGAIVKSQSVLSDSMFFVEIRIWLAAHGSYSDRKACKTDKAVGRGHDDQYLWCSGFISLLTSAGTVPKSHQLGILNRTGVELNGFGVPRISDQVPASSSGISSFLTNPFS